MKRNLSSKRKLPNTWKKRDTIWAIMASICILIFIIHYTCLIANAESSYFPMGQNDNGHFNTDSMALIDSYFDTENNNVIVKYIDYNYYCVSYPKSSTGGVYAEIYSNGTNFSLYTSGSVSISVKQFQIMYGSIVNVSNWGTNLYYFNNSPSSLYNASVDYISNYRVYTNSNKTDVVLKYGQPPFEPAEGHATPTEFNNNDNLINYDPRQPNTPTFPTFPTITLDTTNVETLLASIFDVLSSIGDYVGECFSVFFSWIVDVIQNGIQSIINTIRDFNDNIYANLVSLFEPMFENIKHIVEPVNEQEIVNAFEDTGMYQNYSSLTDLVNESFDVFDSVSEPNTFRIPIHLENVAMLNCSTQYIDLGWFDSCKTAIRAFIWCITTFGLLYTIIDALPSYISGGDE